MTTELDTGCYQALADYGMPDAELTALAADLQALADVRVLDAYSVERKTAFPIWPVCRMNGSFEVTVQPGTSFVGSTADEVRAKFAAWVRGLK